MMSTFYKDEEEQPPAPAIEPQAEGPDAPHAHDEPEDDNAQDELPLVPVPVVDEPQDAPPPPNASGKPHVASPEEAKQYRSDAVKFLKSSPAVLLLLLAQMLAPLNHFMLSELAMATQDWSEKQEQNVMYAGTATNRLLGGRKWPLLEAAKGTLHVTFFTELAVLCTVAAYMWLPVHTIDLKLQNWVCRTLSRMGATVYQLLVVERRRMPWQLFMLLLRPAATAERIRAMCPHLLDTYAASYCARYHDNLCSHDGLIELAMIVLVARTSTVLLECRNAHVQRWIRLMAMQAVDPLLRNLSANFLMAKIAKRKPIEQAAFPDKKPKETKKRRRSSKPIKKTRTKKRGGGAWRAFISERCRGVVKAVFRTLAAEYANLSDAERTRLKAKGRDATIVHRQGAHSFGRATRDIARGLVKAEANRRALALAGEGLTLRTDEQSLAVPCTNIEDEVKKLKADHWLLRKVERESNAVASTDLNTWRRDTGIGTRDKAMAKLPVLSPHAASFCGAPTCANESNAMLLDWCCPFSVQLPRLVTLLMRKVRDVKATMIQHWRQMHQKVRHDTLAICGLRPEPKPSKPTCYEAGICLCGRRGVLIMRLHAWINKVLKTFCKNKHDKGLLEHAWIALRLDYTPYTPPDRRPDGDDGAPAELAEPQPLTSIFAFVALMYFSPYRATYRICNWDGDIDGMGHLHVNAKDEYKTQFELCETYVDVLNTSHSWTGRCYQIHESRRPLNCLAPRHLELESMRPEPLTRIFPVQPSGRDGAFTFRDRCRADLDDISDASSDDNDGDAGDASDDGGAPPDRHLDSNSEEGDGPHSNNDGDDSMSDSDGSKSLASAVSTPPHSSSSGHAPRPPSESSGSIFAPSQVSIVPTEKSDGSDSPPTPVPPTPPSPAPEPMHFSDDDVLLSDIPNLRARRIAPDVLQTPWGTLRYHADDDDMTAVCTWQDHADGQGPCKIRKKTTGHPRSVRPEALGQGRPAARLLCWMQHRSCDRWHHVHDAPVATLPDRQNMRRWIEADPAAAEFCRMAEREQRPDEPSEPPAIG